MSMGTEVQLLDVRGGQQSKSKGRDVISLWRTVEELYTTGMSEDDLLDAFRAVVVADLPAYLDAIIKDALHPIYLKLTKSKREPPPPSPTENIGKTVIKTIILDEAVTLARKLNGRQLKEMGGRYHRLSGLVGPDEVFGSRYSFKETRELLV